MQIPEWVSAAHHSLGAWYRKANSSPGARLHFASQNIGFARSSPRERQSTGLPHITVRVPERQKCRYPNGYPLRTPHPAHGIGKLIARQGLVCILLRKILVSLGQALASGSPLDFRILLFEPLNVKNADTRVGICIFGGSPGARTLDPRLKRALLYQLS